MSFVSFMIINGYFIWLYVTGFTLTFQFDYNYKVNITLFCCRNAYHGASPGTLGILAHNTWKLNVPLSFGFFQV